jgi:hypothetical protein
MILASGARGREFDSRITPIFNPHFYFVNRTHLKRGKKKEKEKKLANPSFDLGTFRL